MSHSDKTAKRSLGDIGEDIVCQHYLEAGYKILDRNVLITHIGEIDIIASRILDTLTQIIFIEVKTRTTTKYGHGYESITKNKLQRIKKCAAYYIGENYPYIKGQISWSFDIASVLMADPPIITIYEAIDI